MRRDCNFCRLSCKSKTSMDFFFFLHSFVDRISFLTIDVSNCIISFFFLKSRTFTFSLQGSSSAYVNCQPHYSCTLGPLVSTLRVTWTQHQDTTDDLITQTDAKRPVGRAYWKRGWFTSPTGWGGMVQDSTTPVATVGNLKSMNHAASWWSNG